MCAPSAVLRFGYDDGLMYQLEVVRGGAIRFEEVGFRYPTRPELLALDGFTLDIAPGETVAVVGPSGAGKSTLFQLAQRFYDPERGRILVDGVPLTDADPADLRARIAMVPQETVIFAASARDNLRYGRWEASDDELWAAAEAAKKKAAEEREKKKAEKAKKEEEKAKKNISEEFLICSSGQPKNQMVLVSACTLDTRSSRA